MRFCTALLLTAVLVATTVAPASGLTRLEIIGRAQRWVDLEVAYSQTYRFETYRQDCSGMASMAWRLAPPGYSTRTLAPYGVPIARDDLQPGDMLLKYDYHAAIFYRWANADHTWYWTLEQSSSAGKAVCRLTRYPYWNHDGFTAYRPRTYTEVDDYDDYIDGIAGQDRYGTAIEASKRAFEDGSARSAVICSGENWPDALGGSALAGALGGPVLLTKPHSLPSAVPAELARLGVTDIVLIGGESAVSTGVAGQLAGLDGVESVARIGGRDRYETAARVASETVRAGIDSGSGYDGGVYVATGVSFPDALGAAPVAAFTGRPIVLARPSGVPTVTALAVSAFGATDAFIAGGSKALTDDVEADLAAAGCTNQTRLAGSDRYETSYLLAEHGVAEGLGWSGLALATGEGFADALAGGVMQARLGSVVVLTPRRHLACASDRAVRDHRADVDTVVVLGGESAISRLARRQIRWIIDEP